MKIAQIAPIIETVPPEKYGGTERVISTLTEELVKRGHDVTLFASGDSKTSAKLFSVFHTALRKANIENVYGHNIWSLLNVGIAYQMQDQFDIIHDHNSQNNPVSLPLANISKVPVVMTLHGPLTNGYSKAFEFYKKPHLVTISKRQREPAPHLNYIGNVYHGLEMSTYPFSENNDGYLLFVGRVQITKGIDEKGLNHAIDIAERTNMPLIIAATMGDKSQENYDYFREKIKPRLSDKIKWIGEVDEVTRNKLMSRAYALIHSINFPEPFGLSLIEAMACGCPVIAFDKGSIPEIIQDNKTGYVVKNADEAVKRINDIPKIDRYYCRTYALKNFCSERMAKDYENIYYQLVEKQSSIPLERKIKVNTQSRLSKQLPLKRN
jgi:glycosyltransferase involved in cell wall biosynthesis